MLVALAAVAAAVLASLLVVRSVSGRQWNEAVVKEQFGHFAAFLEQHAGQWITVDVLEYFLAEQSRPLSDYYSAAAFKWAQALGSARMPPSLVGYESSWADRVRDHNLAEWERRCTVALVEDVLGAAPARKYVSARELAGALDGRKGAKWRELCDPLYLGELDLDEAAVQDASRRAFACLEDQRRAWNRNSCEVNLAQHRTLFEELEDHPLTDAQRRAVVTDEDATLVLAGAGTGKTSVITAKVCYLLESGLAKPEEILVMAYNRKAADELQERIGAAVKGEVPQASTFHAAGLRIIEESGYGNKQVADWTSGERLSNWMRRSLVNMLQDEQLRSTVIAFVTMFGTKPPPSVDEGGSFKTLQGFDVRSRQEQAVSNWLYLNGYWSKYEQPYQEAAVSYEPDWTLGRGIYLEHFGIDRDGNTRPDIDAVSYNESIEWKRQLHQQFGTRMLETFSYEFMERTWQASLQAQLQFHGIPRRHKPIEPSKIDRLLDRQVSAAASLSATFLALMKNAGMTVDEAAAASDNDPLHAYRAECFMSVFRHLYVQYEDELSRSGRIDFADMCNIACEATNTGDYVSPFKFVLVDEFQDITRARAQMLVALIASKRYSKLFAVGDDWQSIYRFAGGEIAVMTSEFEQHFGTTEACELDRSFRYTPSINDTSAEFIERNPLQLPKTVQATRPDDKPGIIVRTYTPPRHDGARPEPDLTQALAQVSNHIDNDICENHQGEQATVMLLGRQHVRLEDAEHFQPDNAAVSFHTIHASKGLEANYVVVLGMSSGWMSFPSDIIEDPILELTRSSHPEMRYGEERRLFYVAVTRAMRRVYLMVDATAPSEFSSEIIDIGLINGDVAVLD